MIARFCVANFFLIFIIYNSHFNLKSICISNTLIWFIIIFFIPLILIIVYVLKFFDLLAKYISLYFFRKNFILIFEGFKDSVFDLNIIKSRNKQTRVKYKQIYYLNFNIIIIFPFICYSCCMNWSIILLKSIIILSFKSFINGNK